jgi:hypothetical protein
VTIELTRVNATLALDNLYQLKLRISKIGEVNTTTKRRSADEEGRFTEEQIGGVLKQHEAGRKMPPSPAPIASA